MTRPHIEYNRLNEKFRAGLPISQEDVEQAREVAEKVQSTQAFALYTQLKRELETTETE